jgi:tetratricopeptide (TPR) repeat protein
LTSDASRTGALLEEAYARFPRSAAVTAHLGTLHQALGDCRAAMRYFNETIALRDHHEDARLGRTICHTYLREPDAAIAEATALFELRSYNQGEALYWRAWNLHEQKDLMRARTDIDRARTLLYNSRVLTLAGMIEHDQNELDVAERDLLEARSLDARNCPAAWYLGAVFYRKQTWLASAAAFSDAEECYAASILETESRREQMVARTDLDPAFRERQLAGFDAALQEDRSQRSAAALNAAMNFARGGDIPNANKFIDSAALDPAREGSILELRKAIEQLQNRQ